MNTSETHEKSTKSVGRGIVIMGVSSTGKSSIGLALAQQLGAKFIDGDDLHPKANILKMANGQPLNDEDRAPWLERIRDAVFSLEKKGEWGIIACSALKKKYRDMIREGNEHPTFLFLQGEFELVLARMRSRKGHFMPIELLQSQFDTLEVPKMDEKDIQCINIDAAFEEVVLSCVQALKNHDH